MERGTAAGRRPRSDLEVEVRRSTILGSFALLCTLAAPAGASAQSLLQWVLPPLSTGAGSEMCQKACPQDYSPCDPLYFKQADRRCQEDPKSYGNHHH
jgi:hypothetical protein